MDQLKQTFFALTQQYTPDEQTTKQLWEDIATQYEGKGRHYHTLDHLQSLLSELTAVKDLITKWDAILFALYYHDAVYNVLKSDNEEKSAVLAVKRMRTLNIPDPIINATEKHILATQKHLPGEDPDTDYFTDADLSILGTDWDTYQTYARNVRKEYSIYPALVYNPGRRKVLESFLTKERIFKTPYFHEKFEASAKQNLEKEIDSLK